MNAEQAPGSGPVVGSQQARAGSSGAIFVPRTREEAAMDAVRQHLHGHADRIQAFAQGELEWAWELERSMIVSFLACLSGLSLGVR